MNRWKSIIEACKDGNAFAQNRVFDFFSARLYRLCMRYVLHDAEAEEVLMNGFLKFFRTLSSFEYRDDNSLEVWLKRIMVNEALMHLRKQKALPVFVEETYAQQTESYEIPDQSIQTEAIWSAILQLPAGYRTVFNLYVIEGYSHDEIAKQLGIGTGTSKSQLNKARTMLQTMLKSLGYEQNRAI